MVFAVQCPNPKCRKFMLVESTDLNSVVACLLCKTAIKVGTPPTPPAAPMSPPPAAPPVRP
jgi:hypothetical protein